MFYSNENFITFEVAKLASKKGFNLGSERYYDEQTKSIEINPCKNNQIALYINGWGEGLYEACTVESLKKWLYEKQNIFIEERVISRGPYLSFTYQIFKKFDVLNKFLSSKSIQCYDEYGEMVNDSLYEALLLI